MSFEDALQHAKGKSYERSVLLGNGFSMAYNHEIFGYDSLAQEAKLTGLSVAKDDLFEELESSNFEAIVELLSTGARLHRLYGGDEDVATTMEADAKIVQNGLADVLADVHPRNNRVLTDQEVLRARTFLANFDQLFTLSYDLLLYWVVNRVGIGPRTPVRDGFEYATADQEGALIWKSNPTQGRQRVFFLHGALHLFVAKDKRLHKLTYAKHGSLIPELRGRLRDGKYPLVVTEGKREEKEARIDRSAYLRAAHRRLASLEGALFVHGVSMSPNDDHIFEPISAEDSRVKALYVGVRGSITAGGGRDLAQRAQNLAAERKEAGGTKLRVQFYDADTAHVWR